MVKRTINWRVLLVTVVVGGLLVGGIYALYNWQISRTAKGLKVLADAQEQKSEWLKAANYLDRYLRLNPDDSATASRLALTYTRGAKKPGEKQRAVSLHYRALALVQEDQAAELRAGLATLLLELGRFTEAEQEARTLLTQQADDPRACRALALALASQLADGSFARLARADLINLGIVAEVEKARRLNPSDARVAAALATIYRESPEVEAEFPQLNAIDRQQRADATMDQLVRDNPQDGTIFLARYRYRLKYSLAEANRDLDEAVRLAPEHSEVLLVAGLQALEEGKRLKLDSAAGASATAQLERAKGFFEKLVAQPVEERLPAAYVSLGDCWLALGQIDTALNVWHDGLKQYRQPTIQIALHAKIAESLLDADRADEAKQSLDEIEKLADGLGTSVPRDYRLAMDREKDLRRARWHIQRGELADAIPKLRSVILRQPQGEGRVELTLRSWILLASAQYSLGEWVNAASSFDEAAQLAPALQQPRLAAAQAYLMAGRPRLATERAEQALSIGKTLDAWLTLASAEFREQVSSPAAERNWQRFLEALDILEQAKPQLADRSPWRIDFLRIDYLMAEAKSSANPDGGTAEAVKVLKAAESAYAGHKAFWRQVCLAYQILGLVADADRALGELRSAGASPAELAVLASRLSAQRNDYVRAEKILEDAAESATVQDRAVLRAELLRVVMVTKNIPKARAILLAENRRQPEDLSVIRRLAELDLEQRDFSVMDEWIRQAEMEKKGVPGKLLAQYLRAWQKYLKPGPNPEESWNQAIHELDQVVLASPNWAEAVALRGLIALRMKRELEAVTDLERAVSLGDRRVLVYEQLIGLLQRQNRWTDVELYLSRLEGELPKSQRMAELASSLELHREQPEDAVKIARQNVTQRPNDPLAHLWLGQMLMLSKAYDEAERSMEQAVEFAPTDPRVWSGVMGLHARTKDRAKAATVLARLEANSKLEATQRSYLLAQGHELLGQLDEAKRQYGELAKQSAADLGMRLRIAQFYLKSDPHEAERILRKALELDAASVAAKRMLAVALASQGGKGLEEAQLLLSQVGTDGTVSMDDQRIKALLLVQQGGVLNLDQAAKIVKGLVEKKSAPAAGDRQLLAQLYERQALLIDDPVQIADKLKAAQTQFELAASVDAAPPASLAAVIQFFARHKRQAEALPWLDKLEVAVDRSSKKSSDLTALVVQMQVLAGVADRSQEWLAKLEQGETKGLRTLALQVQVAVSRQPEADVESLIEPRAAELVAAAGNPAEQAALFGGIGELYTSLKKPAAAERWYRRLVGVAPDQYPKLVGSLASQSRLADAIAACELAAKSDATTRPMLVLTAALTENAPQEQDFKQAEPLLAAAVAKFPSDVGLMYAVTLVRLMQGRNDEAAALYRKILDANPKFVPALNNLAMLLAEHTAQRPEALRLIDKAIEIVGKDPGLLDTKGAILVYSSKPAEALPLLLSATRGENVDPRHHFHLAVAYRDLGKLDEAKAQLKIALERKLESQLLMPSDRRLLAELKTELALETGPSSASTASSDQ